jgi:CRISPR-associated protein Cas1
MTAATPATAPSTPAELSVPVPPASNADQPTPSQPTEVVQTTASEPPQAAIGSHGDPLLRTLYLLEHNTHLTREGDTLVVEPGNGKPAVHVPSARVHQIMAFGAVNLSSGAISLCLERAIPVMLLSGRGRYFGVIDPLRLDNLKLLQAQFAAIGNSATTLALSQAVVAGKIANSQRMLQRWARHRHIEDIKEVLDRMNQYANGARRATDTDQLMGYEGKAAAQYWQTLAKLIGKEWQFSGRKRRPPPDPVNSLLSYGYTLLYYNLLTLVLARGLHPHAGFYHVSRGGHHALVSDLMEEFRAIVVDAIVMDLVLNQRLTPDHFNWPEADGEPCLLSDVARRKLIDAFEARMNAPISHPDVHQRLDYRRVMDMQVLSLCSVLRGTATHYHSFTPR